MKLHNPTKIDSSLVIAGKRYTINAGETAQLSDSEIAQILKVHQFLVKVTEVPVEEKKAAKAIIEEQPAVEVVEEIKEKKTKK